MNYINYIKYTINIHIYLLKILIFVRSKQAFIMITGLSHTGCSLALKEIKADRDAEIVEMLRNAGAIPLCVTNMPEMCMGFDTTNRLYGRTCNPYDARYSSGGSSGGEVI